jgi:hypothetical protein
VFCSKRAEILEAKCPPLRASIPHVMAVDALNSTGLARPVSAHATTAPNTLTTRPSPAQLLAIPFWRLNM